MKKLIVGVLLTSLFATNVFAGGDARKKTVEVARKNYRYEWELPAAGRDPKINIVAWGRDPQYLQYYSIERAN
ncbi:MAG: hypothetical protein LC800_20955 [Acidobacteria bacterium]|nr:hypothetical protein [Acidobacteriota bacterium]